MISQLMSYVQSFLQSVEKKDQEGQTLIEYALIILLIAIAILIVLGLVGGQVQTVFQSIIDALSGATPAP